ncbi:hypothetical protein [Micromonospora yangpuensis]|uniref:Peptidase family M49 n=1 Tax=Micromonospora yangpuensis TaxID=683228 RepID=A0A1C6UA65_9ACTN|nr:hypothetical protein [Micromonospora yangpuensis]GGL87923.1 hypothetical protein GCM10012279_02010 [Micromonospora yangpuensis]SCL50854.1 hypothetical protein GA0070617_1615 [Micromonospora yangpuensis]
MPDTDRFDYADNLTRAGRYRDHRGAFWPPTASYRPIGLDLAPATPQLDADFPTALAGLRTAIEAEWAGAKEHGIAVPRRLADPAVTAAALRRVAGLLPAEADRRAASLRADAVEHGYTDEILKELTGLVEEVTLVAGQVSTWYGKDIRGLPTAFACRRDDQRQADVDRALEFLPDVPPYLGRLHADLRLGDLPAFGAAQLFFMAGEGDLHPKHIAYFLPEDEGVKYSPFKKTYYFANVHRALVRGVSGPLAADLLTLDTPVDLDDERFATIGTLGVLSHEFGHFVQRPATSFKELNAADRWASVVLQEVAADVFGILILAEVWAERLALTPADVIAYYLAECLRYVSRGLGHFPDSDGMYLQLSYLVQVGALETDGVRLVGGHSAVVAGLRSLARVLADFLLAGDAELAGRLHHDYGPANPAPLRALVDALRRRPAGSVEYGQSHTTIATADGENQQ